MVPRTRTLSRYLSLLLPAGIAASALFAGCSNGSPSDDPGCNPLTGCVDGQTPGGACQSNRQFFESQVWAPVISTTCMKCHSDGGSAAEGGAKLTFQSAGYPSFLDNNLSTAQTFSLERTGDKIKLLEKPIGGLNHGGGQVLDPDGREYAALKELVRRFQSGDPCPDSTITGADDVLLLSASATLRKAAIDLGGRLPTADEDAVASQSGDAGEQGLDAALNTLFSEDTFYARLREMFNDVLLTDKYLNEEVRVDTGSNVYPKIDRFRNDKNEEYGQYKDYREQLRREMGSEPMNLIEYIARNDRPFTEILTADYTAVKPWLARGYDVESQIDPNSTLPQPAKVTFGNGTPVPHAGVLSMPSFLQRWPTTRTNRSRARARRVYEFFLDTDILKVADRPVDPSALTAEQNPTLNSSLCATCHTKIDPIAGAFRGYREDEPYTTYQNPEAWHDDMRKAGLETTAMPAASYTAALPWLGQQVASDPRFISAMLHTVFRGLTGRTPLPYPGAGTPERDLRVIAWTEQDQFFRKAGEDFKASNYNIKSIFRSIIKSPYYRGDTLTADAGARTPVYEGLGTGRWLTPEMLHRKVQAVFGYPWRYPYEWNGIIDRKNKGEADLQLWRGLVLTGDYKLLYGGMDSNNVPVRLKDPNGIASSINWRLANEMSCSTTTYDFWKPRDQRRLFPLVDASDRPQSTNNKEIPDSIAAIKDNIVHLHKLILGESLTVDSPEVARTYQLYLDTWLELQASEGQEKKNTGLAYECWARIDYDNLANIEEKQQLRDDKDYTIRAWQAVVAYLLLDYRFLYH